MQHLTKNNILSTISMASDPNSQQTKQLIEFTKDMLRGTKDRKQSDVVVMDFVKAFDKVFTPSYYTNYTCME